MENITWLFTQEVIDMSIELDGVKESDSSSNQRKQQYYNDINKQLVDDDEEVKFPSFDIDSKVTGRIYINITPGQNLYHNGLKISLEQYVAFLYPKLTADLYKIELLLSPNGVFEGNNIIPFEIPMIERYDDKKSSSDDNITFSRISCTKDNGIISSKAEACLFDSYEGVAFSLRHVIIAQVMRPWYAKGLIAHKHLRLFRINIPDETALIEEIIMQIRDIGGKCNIFIPSKWVNLATSPKINFTVAIRDLKRPIVAMYIFLIRAEFIEDEHSDEVILLHRVFGERVQILIDAIPDRACYSEGFESRVDDTDEDPRPDDPIMRGANLAFSVYLTSKLVFPRSAENFIDYDDISEKFPNQKYIGEVKREVNARRNSAVINQNIVREVKPILVLSPSFDTCNTGLDYSRMESAEEPKIKKLPEVKSTESWTEGKFDFAYNMNLQSSNSNSSLQKDNNDVTNTVDQSNNNTSNSNNISNSNDDDDNDILRDSISLRYYIRVLVQDAAGRSCWDTTEIKLYRGGRHISILPIAAAIPDV